MECILFHIPWIYRVQMVLRRPIPISCCCLEAKFTKEILHWILRIHLFKVSNENLRPLHHLFFCVSNSDHYCQRIQSFIQFCGNFRVIRELHYSALNTYVKTACKNMSNWQRLFFAIESGICFALFLNLITLYIYIVWLGFPFRLCCLVYLPQR